MKIFSKRKISTIIAFSIVMLVGGTMLFILTDAIQRYQSEELFAATSKHNILIQQALTDSQVEEVEENIELK